VNSKILLTGLSAASWLLATAYGQPSLEQKLKSQYVLTKQTADRTDIVTPGSVLVLQKDGLLAVSVTTTLPPGNNYKDGRIKQGLYGKWVKLPGGNDQTRTFVEGEKLYLTKIEVRPNDVVFGLISCEAYDNVRYQASLVFQFPKGAVATMDAAQVLQTVNQVFTVAQPESETAGNCKSSFQATGDNDKLVGGEACDPLKITSGSSVITTAGNNPAPANPPPVQQPVMQAPPAPIAAPPPPPDEMPTTSPTTATKTLSLGETTDQVVAIMGRPEKMINLGAKQIYVYKDLKVTFVNGKVSNLE
jgi:hypothetical protein